jgi:transcriptional regulator with XRE-family HTH domain
MMKYTTEGLAAELRQMRKKAGLTQKELGKKTGIPQSHISRIENGTVDIQTSSLVEIARVLGLELMLVPRELVPAVEGLTREFRMNSVIPNTINKNLSTKMNQLDTRFQQLANQIGGDKSLYNLAQMISSLRNIQIPETQIKDLNRIIDQLNPPLEYLESMQKMNESLKNVTQNEQTLKSLNKLNQIGRQLKNLEQAIPKFGLANPIQHRMYLPDSNEEKEED